VSIGAISNVRRGVVGEDVNRQRESRGRAQAEQLYAEATKEIENLRRELDAFTQTKDVLAAYRPAAVKLQHGGRGEATAVVCWNDWHYEEIVESGAVNGVNEYSPSIARQRFTKLLRSTASIIDMCRSKSRIDTIIVGVLGDLITGYIHDELVATNAMSPVQAVLDVFGMLTSGLETLRRETKAKEIIVPCVCGNHGRWTQKTWAKNRPGTSFEGMLYLFLAKWFAAQKQSTVRIVLPKGDMTYVDVYGKRIRFMHGDNVRYAGGIGGVHIPLRKAIDAWNTQVGADYNYLGHWHNDITGEDYRISGSMIGMSEYSLKIKARYQAPSQAFELIHPRYGCTARFPIVLDTKPT
jgi:hypothetical protein